MVVELIKIKNKTDRAFRFTSTVVFMPKEVTVISKYDYDNLPSIALLIERGDFELVKSKPKTKATVESEEIIED